MRASTNSLPLRARYRRLTTAVGLVGVGIGVLLMMFGAGWLAWALGIDLATPQAFGRNQALWMLLFVLWIPAAIYIGCVIAASGVALLWGLLLKRMTARECVRYMLLSRYPASWRERGGVE